MKTCKVVVIVLLTISSRMISGQNHHEFLDAYTFHQNCLTTPSEKTDANQYFEANTYFNREFMEGIIYLKDTTAFKLPLRYNIYRDEMEYQLNGIIYIVGDPHKIKKILLGNSVFIYLPSIQKGCYVEVLQSGKCSLYLKRSIKYTPAEGPKPIVGENTPEKFSQEPDVFYIGVNDLPAIELTNMKSVINALQDQRTKIETFIKTEKLKRANKENLTKITGYYNTL